MSVWTGGLTPPDQLVHFSSSINSDSGRQNSSETMNSLFRSTARCLRSGLAAYPAGGASWAAPARPLCSAELRRDLGGLVKKDKVVVFIKGTPAQPMCGFSNAVVQILRMHGVHDYAAYNVLEDQDLRQGRRGRFLRGSGPSAGESFHG